MWRGVDYYPEQWDEAFLEEDLEKRLRSSKNKSPFAYIETALRGGFFISP